MEDFTTYNLSKTAVNIFDMFEPAPKVPAPAVEPTSAEAKEREAVSTPSVQEAAAPTTKDFDLSLASVTDIFQEKEGAVPELSLFGEQLEAKPQQTEEPTSQPMAETPPQAEPEVASQPTPGPEPEPVKAPEAGPEQTPEAGSEPIPGLQTESRLEPQPETRAESKIDLEPAHEAAVAQSISQPETEPQPHAQSAMASEPAPEPKETVQAAATDAVEAAPPETHEAALKETVHSESISPTSVISASTIETPRSGRLLGIILAAAVVLVLGGFGAFMYMRSSLSSKQESVSHLISTEGLHITNAAGSLEPNGDLLISGDVENSTDKPRAEWLVAADVLDATGKVMYTMKLLDGKQLYTQKEYEILKSRSGVNVQELKARTLEGPGVVIPPKGKVSFEMHYLQPPIGIASFNAVLKPFE